jgi:2-methylisocitrate lyase-like PEP mutase family enzyme
VIDALRCPVNVLARPGAPPIAELAAAGVRRVSTGSLLASRAYGALLAAAKLLRDEGTSAYAEGGLGGETVRDAFRARAGRAADEG